MSSNTTSQTKTRDKDKDRHKHMRHKHTVNVNSEVPTIVPADSSCKPSATNANAPKDAIIPCDDAKPYIKYGLRGLSQREQSQLFQTCTSKDLSFLESLPLYMRADIRSFIASHKELLGEREFVELLVSRIILQTKEYVESAWNPICASMSINERKLFGNVCSDWGYKLARDIINISKYVGAR